MALGAQWRHINEQAIELGGEVVTVKRRGGGSQALKCLPPTPRLHSGFTMRDEAGFNAAESDPSAFYFKGDADVREDVDTIQWEGWNYRATFAQPVKWQGVAITLVVHTVRESKIT